MTAVEYETGWGERVRLVICADRYEQGGALALLALNVTDPGDEEWHLGLWSVLTVNLPGDPVAAAWCADAGRVVVDANGVPAALLDALVGAGVIELSGRSVRSGFCSYPPRDGPASRPRGAPGLPGDRARARPAHCRPRVGGRRGRWR